MSKTIVITPRGYAKFGDEFKHKFTDLGYTLDINDSGLELTREQFLNKAKTATGIIFGVEQIDEELLNQCPNLKAVVKFGVGLDNVDQDACKAHGVKVGRCVGSNSNAVAELTMGLILNAARDIVPTAMQVKNGEWNKPTGFELSGKTIGIIGFGHIGQLVAQYAHGFNMHVLVYDVYNIDKDVLQKYDAMQVNLDDIYKNADVITVHVPLLDSTRNMISTDQLQAMKSTAVLINAARGGIVDEQALLKALKDHQIKAAAFDVFTEEPPKKDGWEQELLQLDNFTLTAHIGSRSHEAERNTVSIATDTMINLLK